MGGQRLQNRAETHSAPAEVGRAGLTSRGVVPDTRAPRATSGRPRRARRAQAVLFGAALMVGVTVSLAIGLLSLNWQEIVSGMLPGWPWW